MAFDPTSSGCQSCDTFVCLPPATADNAIIFGKNSDRPAGEVQEIVYFPAKDYGPEAKLMCTYIEITQVAKTAAIILSKPSWMWGAEMGSNEHGVCVGNEAVWTKLNSEDDIKERLLGMDLVRLGLERSKTAREAVDIITGLLEEYGQGGRCSDTISDLVYHNSFLIADAKEAWVLETAGQLWAAESVTSSFRNISNILSIGTKIDLKSKGLEEKANALGLWSEEDGKFDFAKVFGKEYESGSSRLLAGADLLKESTAKDGTFDINSMMAILRNEESGICRSCTHPFPTTSSQISVLSPLLSCHFFTGTPDPRYSFFKPFIFPSDDQKINWPSETVSPIYADEVDPAKITPRFQTNVDRQHELYKAHELCSLRTNSFTNPGEGQLVERMRGIEQFSIHAYNLAKMERQMCNGYDDEPSEDIDHPIFNEALSLEMNFYNHASQSVS